MRALRNPDIPYAEAKAQILRDLAGLPYRERLDGKCLLANTTLCGLSGGVLTIGTAVHFDPRSGRVIHVWVTDSNGDVQDALSEYYTGHHSDPREYSRYIAASFGKEVWGAALEGVEDVRGGLNIIRAWRQFRGV